MIDKYNPTEIALGMKDGIGNIYKYGENSVIGTTEYPIWDKGGAYYWHPFADAAIKLQIVSDDAADLLNTSGAWTVLLWGLNEDWEFQTELVNLNGLTPVETLKSWRRCFRAWVTAGSTRVGAAGNISIYKTGVPASVISYIKIGDNKTHMTIYTVPAGFAMLIDNADANTGKNFEAKVKLKTMNNLVGTEVELTQATRHLFQNSFTRVYKTPRFIDEKTDIWMSGISSVASVVSSASFEGRLFDKTKFTDIGNVIVPKPV